MDITAIIPVRSGSKRVKNKNLAPFAGSSLLEIKIHQLKCCSSISKIIVSSDDKCMLEVADNMGVMAIKRDSFYASDTVPMSEVYAYMAKQVTNPFVLLTHVTSPLIDASRYEAAINDFINMPTPYDSLITVSPVKEFLMQDGKPLNFDPKKKPRSQDLPNIVKLNHAISILPTQTMIIEKSCTGNFPYCLELSDLESIDIDTPLDFEIAEYLYLKHKTM